MKYEMFLRWPGGRWGGGVWNYHTGIEADTHFQALVKAAEIWSELNKSGEFSQDGIEYRIMISDEVYSGPTSYLEMVDQKRREENK